MTGFDAAGLWLAEHWREFAGGAGAAVVLLAVWFLVSAAACAGDER